jgi:serine/threonine-protein kinase
MTNSATPPDLELLLYNATDSVGAPVARLIGPGVLKVGRTPPPGGLPLPEDDRKASGLHFIIFLEPTSCRLCDCSKHGTFVNGMAVLRADADLRHSDVVRASRSVFRVELRRRGQPADLVPSPTVVIRPPGEATQSEGPVLPAPTAPLPATVQVPGYRLLPLPALGNGSGGAVWLAEASGGGLVALKLLHPDPILSREVRVRFERESSHLRDLRHRYIVGFRDAGVTAEGRLYLAMEYVNGRNAAKVVEEQGPMEVGRAVRLACQVLEALAYAHGAGVVHRDVKPSNILLTEGPAEEVRLADFGLAKAYQSAAGDVTLPDAMGGTLAYVAPDQLADFRRAGPLADQFSAAATLYHLLSGRCPYDATTNWELLDRIRQGDVLPLSRRRGGLPDGLAVAVHRALERDPKGRFPTAEDFRQALLPFAAG